MHTFKSLLTHWLSKQCVRSLGFTRKVYTNIEPMSMLHDVWRKKCSSYWPSPGAGRKIPAAGGWSECLTAAGKRSCSVQSSPGPQRTSPACSDSGHSVPTHQPNGYHPVWPQGGRIKFHSKSMQTCFLLTFQRNTYIVHFLISNTIFNQ